MIAYSPNAVATTLSASSALVPLSLPTKLVLGTLAVYCHWDALTPYGAPLWPIAYAAAMCNVALLTLSCRRPQRYSQLFQPAVIALSLLILLGILTAFQQDKIYPRYFFGDIARLLFPIIFINYGRYSPDLFEHPASGRVLMAAMLSAALCAPLFSFYAQPYVALLGSVRVTDLGRYDPPHPLLIVLLWYNLFTRGSFTGRMQAIVLLLIAATLAFFSQQRTNALSFIILGGVTVFIEYRPMVRRISTMLPLLLVVGLVAIGALAPLALGSTGRLLDRFEHVLSYSRFSKLKSGPDDSVGGRINEAQDVTFILRNSSTLPWLWGMGHGATFTPISSNPLPNLIENHRVHHIHIGIVQLWFRYGVAGVILLLLIIVSVARTLLRLHFQAQPPPLMQRIWTVAIVGELIVFLVFGTLQDPFLSLCLAGFYWRHHGNA